ncbi:MAG: DUF11 domain-containing protein, partial [Chloroflexi bacterium]|nr:DUF11 domain-containing protein [Chloroflexota bacterium]
DNGPLVNCAGCGAGGAYESVLQISLGMNTLRFGHAVSSGFRVADDFTITDPGGWTVDAITFYAYQTNSGNTSTINAVNLRIWDGPPGQPGSSVVWGDTTTDRLSNTVWSNIYRVSETSHGNTARPIMSDTATVGASLPPGTYWLDWQSGGTLDSGPWAPPITINGQTTTGNGLQYDPNTTLWNPANDGGTLTQQGFPFILVGSVNGPAGVSAAHFPVAVIPTGAVLPDLVSITTRRNAGSQLVEDLQSAYDITDLTVTYYGLTQAELTTQLLGQDPTRDNPYDNLNDGTTFYTTVAVAAGALHLITEIYDSTAVDMDLFMGQDLDADGPEASEQLCSSTTPTAEEYCQLDDPAAGNYWVLVQNWDDSDNPPDTVTLATAVVPDSDNGNMTVTGPGSVGAGELFDIRVYWDTPEMMAGDRWYGEFALGTDPGNEGNVGSVPVIIKRIADDVSKTVSSPNALPGATLTYTITVQPNVTAEDLTYAITDTIPAGLTYVPGSATGGAVVVGDTLTWGGVMPAPGRRYAITTSDSDPSCAMPLATGGAYIDLALYGIFAQSGIFGDTVTYSMSLQGATNFYGQNVGTNYYFTDDGFGFFDPSTPGSTPWVNTDLPDPGDPNNLEAMFWQDLEIVYDAGRNRGVTLAYLTNDDGLPVADIIEYDDVEVWGQPSQTYDFEGIIYYTV